MNTTIEVSYGWHISFASYTFDKSVKIPKKVVIYNSIGLLYTNLFRHQDGERKSVRRIIFLFVKTKYEC